MSSPRELERPISNRYQPVTPEFFRTYSPVNSPIRDIKGMYPYGYVAFEILLESGILITLPKFREHEVLLLAVEDRVKMEMGANNIVDMEVSRGDQKPHVKLKIGLGYIYDVSKAAKNK